MNTLQYIRATDQVFERVRARIGTIGDIQYSFGETQNFETLTYAEIVRNACEELEDLIAYAAQLHIRLGEVLTVLERK